MAQLTTAGLLVISAVANVVLGTQLYERLKVTVGDYSVYESFKTSLNGAVAAVDNVSHDVGQKKTQDVVEADINIDQAVGILTGLRPEADKRKLDFGPIIGALRKSELPTLQNPSPSSKEDSMIQQTQNTLHTIQAGLKGTTYQSGKEFTQLKAAVNSLNNKLWG